MVKNVSVFLVDEKCMSSFYFSSKKPHAIARECMDNGMYKEVLSCAFDTSDDEVACEELFDLTNNPSRTAERLALYGRRRSISVGDVIKVDNVPYVCAPDGWGRV